MTRILRSIAALVLVSTGLLALESTVANADSTADVAWVTTPVTGALCGSACGIPDNVVGGEMAYDAATQQLLYFGGNGNATWVWSGTSWSQVDDATDPGCIDNCVNSPPDSNTSGLTYDASSGQVIAFGGTYEENSTWAWNGTTWVQVADTPGCGMNQNPSCSNSPPGTIGTQMAYDPVTQQVVVFGGAVTYTITPNDNFTWVLSYSTGSYSWAQVDDSTDPGCLATCVNSPPGRNVGSLAFDYATQQLVLFGGEQTGEDANGLSDTWVWDGTTWTQVDDGNGAFAGCGESWPIVNQCPSSPPGRVGFGMTYDPALGDLVLFGGMNRYGNPEYNDTWAWDGTTWTQVNDEGAPGCVSTCPASPTANDTFALADDPATDQLVMYGSQGTWIAYAVPEVVSPGAPAALQLSTSDTVVNGTNIAAINAQWNASPNATSYTCTLLYGYNEPSTFVVQTTSTSCQFSGLALSTDYGVSVVANSGSSSSSGTTAFGKTPSLKKITCRHGKRKITVTAVNPICPRGWHPLG